jgi:hypothetical protein
MGSIGLPLREVKICLKLFVKQFSKLYDVDVTYFYAEYAETYV